MVDIPERRVLYTQREVRPFNSTVVVVPGSVLTAIEDQLPDLTCRTHVDGVAQLSPDGKARIKQLLEREHLPCATDPAAAWAHHNYILISPSPLAWRSGLSLQCYYREATAVECWRWPGMPPEKLFWVEARVMGNVLSVRASDGRVLHQGLPAGVDGYFIAAAVNAFERGLLQVSELSHLASLKNTESICRPDRSYIQNMTALILALHHV